MLFDPARYLNDKSTDFLKHLILMVQLEPLTHLFANFWSSYPACFLVLAGFGLATAVNMAVKYLISGDVPRGQVWNQVADQIREPDVVRQAQTTRKPRKELVFEKIALGKDDKANEQAIQQLLGILQTSKKGIETTANKQQYSQISKFFDLLKGQEFNVYQVLQMNQEQEVPWDMTFGKLIWGHMYLIAARKAEKELVESLFTLTPPDLDAVRGVKCHFMVDFGEIQRDQTVEAFMSGYPSRAADVLIALEYKGYFKRLLSTWFGPGTANQPSTREAISQATKAGYPNMDLQIPEHMSFQQELQYTFHCLIQHYLQKMYRTDLDRLQFGTAFKAQIDDGLDLWDSLNALFRQFESHVDGARVTAVVQDLKRAGRALDPPFDFEFDPKRAFDRNLEQNLRRLAENRDQKSLAQLQGLIRTSFPEISQLNGSASKTSMEQSIQLIRAHSSQQTLRNKDLERVRLPSMPHFKPVIDRKWTPQSNLDALFRQVEAAITARVPPTVPLPPPSTEPLPPPPSRGEYTVVFLGESGTGKSTTICSIGNYLKYRTFEEARRNKMDICIPLRFTATPEGGPVATVECFPDSVDNSANENFNEAGQSVTQEARVHTFDYKEARFRIIDTPGLSDTRGMQQDTVNLDKIRAVVNQQEQIHAICLVLKSNESRLRPEFELATRQLLSLFPKKALDNVFLFFTFASGTFFAIGDSVEMLSTLQQKLTQSHGRCFQIQQNTCCIDAESFKYRLCQERSIRYSSRSESSFHHCWDHSAAQITSFLTFLQKMQPISGEEIKRVQQHVQLGEALARDFVEGDNAELQRLKGDVETVLFHVKNEAMPFNVNLLSVDRDSPLQKDVSEAAFNASLARLSRFSKTSK